MNKKIKKLSSIIIILTIGFPLLFYIFNIHRFLLITTPSMEKTIPVGSLVYYDEIEDEMYNDYLDNKIVVIKGPQYYYEHGVPPKLWSYISNNTPIVHRVVNAVYNYDEAQWYYETKGDNNEFSDGCIKGYYNDGFGIFVYNISDPILIPRSEIIGIIKIIIPYIGYFGLYFQFFLVGFVIFIILMFIFDYYKIKLIISLQRIEKIGKL